MCGTPLLDWRGSNVETRSDGGGARSGRPRSHRRNDYGRRPRRGSSFSFLGSTARPNSLSPLRTGRVAVAKAGTPAGTARGTRTRSPTRPTPSGVDGLSTRPASEMHRNDSCSVETDRSSPGSRDHPEPEDRLHGRGRIGSRTDRYPPPMLIDENGAPERRVPTIGMRPIPRRSTGTAMSISDHASRVIVCRSGYWCRPKVRPSR